MRTDRTYWWADMPKNNDSEMATTPMQESNEQDGNLVSSLLTSGLHSPVLDIDFAAQLLPSSTPGHFHLYLDGIAMPWERYGRLLNALAEAQVLGEGYVYHSLQRGQTVLRRPGVLKGAPT